MRSFQAVLGPLYQYAPDFFEARMHDLPWEPLDIKRSVYASAPASALEEEATSFMRDIPHLPEAS